MRSSARPPGDGIGARAAIGRLTAARDLLVARLDALEVRLTAGDEAAWLAFTDTVRALVAVVAQGTPGASGELLTTQQMAERLGLAPKTLRKHAATGAVRPFLRRGKLIRWKGDEVPR